MNIDILTNDELTRMQQLLAEANNIVIIGHKSPDGDAMGAILGWADYLQNHDKNVSVIVPDAYPDFLQWLPFSNQVVRYDKHPDTVKDRLQACDLLFCLDFNELSRLDGGRLAPDSEVMSQLVSAVEAPRVMIDHHLNPNVEGLALCISHPEMCSTCELVFRIINQLGGFEDMTRRCAIHLYTGMMTDTGGFTFASSRPEIYTIIGMLLEKRIDKDKIYRNVFNNYSSWAIRLRGYLMSHKLNVFEDYHAAYFSITRKEMKQYHFIKGDAEGLVNEPLRIKGLKLSISLREDTEKDNIIWVSLRSVDDFPANEVAAKFFNGGGHLNASGGRLNCSMEEAEQVVRRAFKDFEAKLKA